MPFGPRPARLALLAGLLLALPSALAAQRGEITVLGGPVFSPDEEFDRVTSTQSGPPTYTRERGSRSSGAALGVSASFAIRGHVFAELGLLSHGVERSISRTGTGDPDGPFLTTRKVSGRIVSLWVGPAYRFVDRERLAVSLLAAPTLNVMLGDAFREIEVGHNAPTRRTALGIVVGLRGRYWMTERVGLQVAVDDAMWTFPLAPHPTDGTPLYPENYRKTPLQHDLRVHLGASFKLF